MNTEHTFGLRTKQSCNMILRILKDDTLTVCNKYVPRSNCVREKTLRVPIRSAYQFTKGVTFVSTRNGYGVNRYFLLEVRRGLVISNLVNLYDTPAPTTIR